LTREELFETVIELDEDGSGNISLDEFLTFFGQVNLNEDESDDFQRQ
jgi:Ca2+-binding EF-hand superfamily protein